MSRLLTVTRSHPWASLAVAVAVAVALSAAALLWPAYQAVVGQIPSLVAPIGAWVALFPNEAKRLISEFSGRFFYWSSHGERLAVGAGLESDFALATRSISEQAPGSFKRSLRVVWHRGRASEPELDEGIVIVKLRDHRTRTANLVSTALAQVAFGAMHRARPHLDPDVSRAADFSLARALLNRIDEAAAYFLVTEVCLPECRQSPRLAKLVEQTRLLDERGLFTRVAVREFVELGERLGNQLPSAEAASESEAFVEYLHRIAVKSPYEDLDDALAFSGKHLRVGVVLVARPAVFAVKGETAYTGRVGEYAKNGFPVVYLAARGSNIEYAREVSAALRAHGNVTSLEEFEYTAPYRAAERPTYLARVTVNLWLSRRAERRFVVLRPDKRSQVS